MKKPKAPRVPVLESAFEINLPELLRATKASGSPLLTLDGCDVRTVVAISENRLAVHLGGRAWIADIVVVPCLNNRARPLLKCPRAHEGNFQTLYYRAGELACRHCHNLRYRSTLAASSTDRARIARHKLLAKMGGAPGEDAPERRPGAWRKKHARQVITLGILTKAHYDQLRAYVDRHQDSGP